MTARPRCINGSWRAICLDRSDKQKSREPGMKSQFGQISYVHEGHVAVLTIDRPPHNHVSIELMRDLADALVLVDAERDLRVSVIAAAGKSFCAGADLAAPSGVGGGVNQLYIEAVRLFSA